SVDANGPRAEKTQLGRMFGIRDLDELDRRLDVQLGRDLLDPPARRLVVRAATEVEDFDAGRSHGFGASIRQQAATCSALSASSEPASSSIRATRSSATRL